MNMVAFSRILILSLMFFMLLIWMGLGFGLGSLLLGLDLENFTNACSYTCPCKANESNQDASSDHQPE